MRSRSAITLSGDTPRVPAWRARLFGSGPSRIPGAGYVALAAALALVPLGLAVLAFGHSFRTTETDRVESRLQAEDRNVLDVAAAATRRAATEAAAVAAEPATQRALLAGRPAAGPTGLPRWLRVETVPGVAMPPAVGPLAITRSVDVVSRGSTVGSVRAVVSLPVLVRGRAGTTDARLGLAVDGRGTSGAFGGARVSGAGGSQVRGRDDTYRVFASHIAPRTLVVAGVPTSTIDASVHHRQLVTFAAGAVTIAALALIAILVLAARGPTRLGRAIRGQRSPVALVGDVAAAAHDPRALLPVLLETAVVATHAAGGEVIWDGERIASLGGRGASEPLVLPLDEAEPAASARAILLHPRRGFSTDDENVARSLVAQGRIALENARLQSIVRRQAVTDELTDLSNRRRFMEEIQLEIARAERLETSLALVLFDLDHFKQINDRFGHQTGDVVLRATAGVIRDRVRETDVPARIGGEEFAIVLPGTDRNGARSLAENLRADISALVGVPNAEWRVTASFGVAEHVRGETADTLIAAADRALYRAKAEGRDRVCLAEHEESPAA
ncbi:MAG TPA: GGDEF domain-containing protein [Gaiellaceae bacterium]|nr:GGDEF domain-containing protein [Gaiellaceae bacterium]